MLFTLPATRFNEGHKTWLYSDKNGIVKVKHHLKFGWKEKFGKLCGSVVVNDVPGIAAVAKVCPAMLFIFQVLLFQFPV